MMIDYSQTVNRYTQLDTYPLPIIEDQINEIAKNSVFSAIDLKDAYYLVPFTKEDKRYTACGKQYQYKRMPFGVTNGAPYFQRAIVKFITNNQLEGTFAYLDNISVCDKDQGEGDQNLNHFLEAAKANNLVFKSSIALNAPSQHELFNYLDMK